MENKGPSLLECFEKALLLLMEGALGERLKREYGLQFDEQVAMAALVRSSDGRRALSALWREYAAIAQQAGVPFLATTPTRRANRERMARAGFSADLMAENVRFLREQLAFRRVLDADLPPVFAGGLMGCRGDAYTGEGCLPQEEAFAFHSWQADAFCRAGTDFLYAGILPTLPEAIGMARAMAQTGLPYLISFTIRENGCLIDGTPIHLAIRAIDAAVFPVPLGYMTNCVHPSILRRALLQPVNRTDLVRRRFCGIQANTSPLSYEQLDQAQELYTSSPQNLAGEMVALHREFGLRLFGGCCGTDGGHLRELVRQLGKEPPFAENSVSTGRTGS